MATISFSFLVLTQRKIEARSWYQTGGTGWRAGAGAGATLATLAMLALPSRFELCVSSKP